MIKLKQGNIKIALFHVLAWLAYNSLTVYYNVVYEGIQLKIAVAYCLLFMLMFYINLFTLNKAYRNLRLSLAKPLHVALCFVLVIFNFLGIALIGYLLVYQLLPRLGYILFYEHVTFNWQTYLWNVGSRNTKFMAYSLVYFFVKRTINTIRLKKETEISMMSAELEKAKYEQAWLRAQINPHFLHNSLNMLYGEAIGLSANLAENIRVLSNMLRYFVDNANLEKGLVPLDMELAMIRDYVKINQERFGNTKYISFKVAGDTDTLLIPPLSLLTIVENAFAYGNVSDPLTPLHIQIIATDRMLSFCCRNKKKHVIPETDKHHVGLRNLTRRMRAHYGNKVSLRKIDESGTYTMEVTIRLKD